MRGSTANEQKSVPGPQLAGQPICVALISSYVPDGSESMPRYGKLLERILRARGYSVLLMRPPAVLGRLPLVRGGLAKWLGYIDKFLIAPAYLRWKVRQADIVHICDHSFAMYLSFAGKKPTAITCHDLLAVRSARGEFPGVHVGRSGRLLQRWIATSLLRARYVICVSHKTERDLRALDEAMVARFKVIHHSLNGDFQPAGSLQIEEALATLGLKANCRYLLHVGNNSWYKDRPAVMRIFAQLRGWPEFKDMKLIMAGKPWNRELRNLFRSAALEDAAIEAPNVSEEVLRGLYSGAQALLYPSREEGFGWPILEAQACGCVVITTNRAPMNEIAGEAAILIDPEDPGAAARAIREQWSRRGELRQDGFANLERFTEERVARDYWAAYEEILSMSSPLAQTR